MNLTQQIVRKPPLHLLFPSRTVIQAAQQKPGILIAVRKPRKIDSPPLPVSVTADMDLPIGVLHNLRIFRQSVNILHALAKIKGCTSILLQEMRFHLLIKVLVCGKAETKFLINAQHIRQLEKPPVANGSPIPTNPPPS